ncbi:MAG TPA: GDSL-type esterase/lipase family protein [Edaphobacter sp.]
MQPRQASVLILAAVLTLCGCKSTPPSPEPSAATNPAPSPSPLPEAPAEKDARPVIVAFGDSLTAGYGTEPGQSYPDYLQADLDKLGYHYRVVNAGISGNTTKDGVERVDSIVAMHPALVIVEFGGNDGLRGLRIEDSRANLDKIVSTLQASGTKVVLAGITLPPDYGPDYIRQFNETYVMLAKKFHVPLHPFILQGVFGADGMMQRDNTHATAAGNQVVAKNLLPLVTPLLKK